jgi:hypothetical protein
VLAAVVGPDFERRRAAELALRLGGSSTHGAVPDLAPAQQLGYAPEKGAAIDVYQWLSETSDDVELIVGESEHGESLDGEVE